MNIFKFIPANGYVVCVMDGLCHDIEGHIVEDAKRVIC